MNEPKQESVTLGPFLALIMSGIVLGIFVGLGTELLLTRQKSHDLPGGAIAVGLLTALRVRKDFKHILAGGLSGVIGWILYLFLFPL